MYKSILSKTCFTLEENDTALKIGQNINAQCTTLEGLCGASDVPNNFDHAQSF